MQFLLARNISQRHNEVLKRLQRLFCQQETSWVMFYLAKWLSQCIIEYSVFFRHLCTTRSHLKSSFWRKLYFVSIAINGLCVNMIEERCAFWIWQRELLDSTQEFLILWVLQSLFGCMIMGRGRRITVENSTAVDYSLISFKSSVMVRMSLQQILKSNIFC